MRKRLLKTLGTAAGTAAAATAGLGAWNARLATNVPALGPAIDAPFDEYDWDAGRVGYYRAGEGHPVLLLHSHNAAATAYEVRQIFRTLSNHYAVYAPDLPGYGRSERRARTYSAHTYVRFLHDFVHDVIQAPAAVIAPSATAAQAMLAVAEDAHAFSHLVAVSPTGLAPSKLEPPPTVRALGMALGVPIWGQSLYNGIASRQYIRSFLESRVYDNPWNVTHEMVEYAWTSAHQPNARYAPSGFLNGALWVDARGAYEDIRRPMLMVWGMNDRLNPYEDSADVLARNPNVPVEIVPDAGGAPYDEQVEQFHQIVVRFLSETGAPPGGGRDRE